VFNRLTPIIAFSLAAMPLAAQTSPPQPPPFVPFTQAEHDRYLARGKQVMGWFLAGHADSLLTALGGEMAAQMDLAGIRQQMDGFAERAGTPTNVLAEKMTRRMGTPQFWWEAEVTNFTAEPVVMRWLFNEELQVVGVGFTPKNRAPSDPEG
jgi:hypothetical protein